jgi:cobalt/nickel transport system ATP-binding protein
VTFPGGGTDPEPVRDRLGVLLQDPDDYLFNSTVREDIEYGPAQLGVDRADARERIAWLADRLDLADLLDRPPFRLSAGEKERAALAAALAADPDVLLVDEPTSNLDAPTRTRALALLDELVAEDDLALVTFTPSAGLVPRVADRVLLLARDGTVAARGPIREVLTEADLLAAHGLRPPPAVRLFDGLTEEPPLSLADGRDRLDDLLG